jgi:hypothetical protein
MEQGRRGPTLPHSTLTGRLPGDDAVCPVACARSNANKLRHPAQHAKR